MFGPTGALHQQIRKLELYIEIWGVKLRNVMSKKIQKNIELPSNGECIAQYPDCSMRYLEGQLLTIVESIGMPQKQEEAIKSLIRNTVWLSWQEAEKVIEPYPTDSL